MEPNLIQELMQLPTFTAFVSYVKEEADKLNRLEGLDGIVSQDIALEVKSRAKAYATLQSILSPLLTPQTPITVKNKDYDM